MKCPRLPECPQSLKRRWDETKMQRYLTTPTLGTVSTLVTLATSLDKFVKNQQAELGGVGTWMALEHTNADDSLACACSFFLSFFRSFYSLLKYQLSFPFLF